MGTGYKYLNEHITEQKTLFRDSYIKLLQIFMQKLPEALANPLLKDVKIVIPRNDHHEAALHELYMFITKTFLINGASLGPDLEVTLRLPLQLRATEDSD